MNVLRIAGLAAVVAVLGCGMAVAQDAAARPDGKIKTKSNIKNDRAAGAPTQTTPAPTPAQGAVVKSKSNITNNPGAEGETAGKSASTGSGVNKKKSNVKNNLTAADAGKVKSHSNSTNNHRGDGASQ